MTLLNGAGSSRNLPVLTLAYLVSARTCGVSTDLGYLSAHYDEIRVVLNAIQANAGQTDSGVQTDTCLFWYSDARRRLRLLARMESDGRLYAITGSTVCLDRTVRLPRICLYVSYSELTSLPAANICSHRHWLNHESAGLYV